MDYDDIVSEQETTKCWEEEEHDGYIPTMLHNPFPLSLVKCF